MIVYQIKKKKLNDRDFKNIRSIKYDNDKLILIQVLPRRESGEKRKKIIVTVPASECNWQIFKEKYFGNSINSNI